MDIKQSLSSCANDARSEEDAMIIMQAVRRIKELESGLVAAQERNVDYEADIVTRRLDYTEDCKRLDARIEELELRIADESRACALFQSHIRELEAALTAAQERNTALQSEHLDHVNALHEQLTAMTAERDSETRWAKQYSDEADELRQQLAAAQENTLGPWFLTQGLCTLDAIADHIITLQRQLTAAQKRERMLNDDLYYACELAIAYAHSEKDKEWAAERIEELMPPEQEVADESL